VGVSNLVLERAVGEPVLLEAAGPAAQDRVGLVLTPGRFPEVDSVAAGEREQPPAEIGSGDARRRCVERIVGTLDHLDGAAEADDDADDDNCRRHE
jgi:hypothetical protein